MAIVYKKPEEEVPAAIYTVVSKETKDYLIRQAMQKRVPLTTYLSNILEEIAIKAYKG